MKLFNKNRYTLIHPHSTRKVLNAKRTSVALRLREDWFAGHSRRSHTVLLLQKPDGRTFNHRRNSLGSHRWNRSSRLQDEKIQQFQMHIYPWQMLHSAKLSSKILVAVTSWAIANTPKKANNRIFTIPQTDNDVSELERYRQVGRLASEAMTEVLSAAKPTWTEYQLAGAGAEALWARGLHPALTLVAGERRLPLYRHATATAEQIGRQAMLVFCARGWGLYANLTRFVSFDFLGENHSELHRQVREIEAAGLNSCRPGVSLNAVYDTLKSAYEEEGYPQAIRQHHQGGTTGYLAREVVANPGTSELLAELWPCLESELSGRKIEDTL